MILHYYFARKYLWRLTSIAGILYALIVLVELMDIMRDFVDVDVSFGQVLHLTFLKTASRFNQILALVFLLATITLFVGLARTSEMVVTRAAGRSALRALMAPVSVALIIGVFAVAVYGPISVALSKRYTTLSEHYLARTNAALSVSSEGVWLRQGSRDGQTVIHAARANGDASELFDVSFLSFGPQGKPKEQIVAARAALEDGAWQLAQAKVWPLTIGAHPEAEAEHFTQYRLPSPLTPDRIRESLGNASGVSIWDMPQFISQLEQSGFSARRHKVWFHTELARPLFLTAMVLIGAAFTMKHTRFGGVGSAVLGAIMLGFTLYFARSFASILGENGLIAAMLAGWAVPIAANMLALGLLLHAEDG
jgi:lipopolysaccharide export system permease protein